MKLTMTRRDLLWGISALAGSVVLAGCGASNTSGSTDTGSSSGNAGTDGSSASAAKKLIVGFDSAYPPYGYSDPDNPGSYTGFDLELAQEAAKRNDWEIQLEPIEWDAKDTLLKSGAINCIWNGFTVKGR